jgi:cytochrome c oxidase cbb3-type subunit III
MTDHNPQSSPSQPSVAPPGEVHEYDGIQEYDNPLPRWWVWSFWASFVFSLGYLVHYPLTGNGPSVLEAYEADMASFREAEAIREMGNELTEEVLTKLMNDRAMMKDAALTFQARCLQCHSDRGQGGIGPNLTDDSWIHGKGSLMDIYRVVNEGVLSKGMPNWGRQLKPIELRKVVSYVGTLRGTNVPGKAPEGTAVLRESPPKGGG